MRVSKALFHDKMHARASYRCARRSRAACRSGVSNPSVNQAYRSLSCRLASSDLFCAIHNRARLIVARSSNDLACWERAIEIARSQQARSLELRATMSLARLWITQNRSDDARRQLSDVYAWFTEGFETPDLQAARLLLAQL